MKLKSLMGALMLRIHLHGTNQQDQLPGHDMQVGLVVKLNSKPNEKVGIPKRSRSSRE